MMFQNLLKKENSSPGEQQKQAREQLPLLIKKSMFSEYERDALSDRGTKLLLIIASYSLEDLRLLDKINDFLSKSRRALVSDVYVYDASDIRSMEELNVIIPNIGNAYQTPMIGLWKDGYLEKKSWGYDAVKELYGIFDLK